MCLLPLLRAAALFTLRGDAATGDSAVQAGTDSAESPPAAHAAANSAATDLPEDCDGEETLYCQPSVPRMHIELALCRSRRDAGSHSFDQLGSCERLAHLTYGLCKVISKARSQSEESPAGASQEQEEPCHKRRRINSIGSAGHALDQTPAATAHQRRWETAEAAEEEMCLLEGEARCDLHGALRDFVRESQKVYEHIDDFPIDWRLLPIDLLWAAAPITRGFIRDPLHLLSRRLKAAKEKEQDSGPGETETDPEPEMLPLLNDLLCSPFPCVCTHIDSWRWRSVGVTAFFGPFGDQHGAALEQADAAGHGLYRAISAARCRGSVLASQLQEPQLGADGFEGNTEGKRLRREVRRILTALVHDVLQFTGIPDPELGPVAGDQHQDSTQGTKSLSQSGPSSNAQKGRPETEGSSNLESLGRDPESAKGGTTVGLADTQPDTHGPQQEGACSIACFAKQTFTSSFSPSERLCNCFYFQASSESCRPQVHRRTSGSKSPTSYPEPGSGDCYSESERARTRHEWRAFARRLVATAAKKVVKSRGVCACKLCCCGAGSAAEPCRPSNTTCTWRSFIWSECSKLLHSILAAASSHSTILRLALPRPLSKKRNKKRQQTPGVPLSADPLPPMARQDFLQRVLSAYVSPEWATMASRAEAQTKVEAKPAASPPGESDGANMSADRGTSDQSSVDGEAQHTGNEGASKLWTPEEVLHWQFGCSMWCNSALRVLSAQHLAQLLQLRSCSGS